jgi:hypothetical protein
LAACTGILAGCATTYHPLGGFMVGGYSAIETSSDSAKVTFAGNRWTSITRAQDFALLRAAELCQQRGFLYFSSLGENAGLTDDAQEFPGKGFTSPSGRIGVSSAEVIEVDQPYADLAIRFYKEKPNAVAKAFLATEIIGQIRNKYRME